MKRPVRDERWSDPEGREWQVEQVARWRTETRRHPETGKLVGAGRYTVAFYRMRNTAGEECRVTPAGISSWARLAEDPLAGQRVRLSNEIRDGAVKIVMPAPGMNPVCPVKKGEKYHLASGAVVIDTITRKVVKGRDAEWHIEFVRLLKDRDFFLRSVVPGAKPDEIVRAPTFEDIQKARIDGNYKHTVEQGGDDLSVVPPEWEDRKVTVRKVAHLESLDSRGLAEDAKRQRKAAKATLDATLSGLTPENQQHLLARIVSECEAARMEEAA